MRTWGLKIAAAACLLGLSGLATAHPTFALGVCRSDPTVDYLGPQGAHHHVRLLTEIGLAANEVSQVTWTLQVPKGSTVLSVRQDGKLPESVSVTTDGTGNGVAATTFVASQSTGWVHMYVAVGHNQENTGDASGSTNQLLSATATVQSGDDDN